MSGYSVLGNGGLRESFRRLRGRGPSQEGGENSMMGDTDIFQQTFSHHWAACQACIQDYQPLSDQAGDIILTVGAQLEQMLQLLQLELNTNNNSVVGGGGRTILDSLLSDRECILGQMVDWSRGLPYTQSDPLLTTQLRLLDLLISCHTAHQSVISHGKVAGPLVGLLELVANLPASHQPSPALQAALLPLLHTVVALLVETPALLPLFTQEEEGFVVFSLLTRYLHSPGQLGQTARDALLLCISLSCRHSPTQTFISHHSNFCPVLATGLSGLWSALPRTLPPATERLQPAACPGIPGLPSLITSLELCSAVIEVAPRSVCERLLELTLAGFLQPVVGPALAAADPACVAAATAYTELCLRVVTAPPLLGLWVRFLLTGGAADLVVERVGSRDSAEAAASLVLLETLLSLNMEDVLVSLVFRHLVTGSFLLPAHRSRPLQFSDPHGRAAYRLLSLVPVSCDPPATPQTPRRGSDPPPAPPALSSQGYQAYLSDAQAVVRQTALDCETWCHGWDRAGPSVPSAPSTSLSPHITAEAEDDSGDSDSCYLSGGWDSGPVSEVALTTEEEREFWQLWHGGRSRAGMPGTTLARLQQEDRLSLSSLEQDSQGGTGSETEPSPRQEGGPAPGPPPTLGPLLTALLARAAQLPANSLSVNLRLTAVLSKLASFPQPLLRAVLLHPDLVVQPGCSTLLQAICTSRHTIDAVMPGLVGAEQAVREAREELQARVRPPVRSPSNASLISLPASLNLRQGGGSLLRLLGRRAAPAPLATPPPTPPHTRQMALAAVLLEEWLQELAALAQEHSVLHHHRVLLHRS